MIEPAEVHARLVPTGPARLAALLIPLACAAAPSAGQSPVPSREAEATLPAEPSPSQLAPTPEDAPAVRFPVILLREGQSIVDARGVVRRDPDRGTWEFIIDDEHPGAGGHRLTLLPCSRLAEITRAVEASPERDVVFEITGQVYVFDGRNYVLPLHAPQLTQRERTEDPLEEREDGAPGDDPPAPANLRPGEAAAGDVARNIMADLERAVGPLARTTTANTSSDAPGDGAHMREGALILSRRGQIRRDRRGAWVFLFDADAEGLADPPVILLPCLLLERIEKHARRGENIPVLLSGSVYTFRGMHYLMPSNLRVPRQRTPLSP